MNNFNKRVKELRLKSNFSLRQLASISGLSPSALHAYEVGKREPTRVSLEALADVFNCDIDYLLGKSDIKNKAANALGYDSLYEAWLDKKLPEQQILPEGEMMLLELFRKLPKEAQESYTERLREALKTLGLI